MEITFSAIWQATKKIGCKEKLAKRFNSLPMVRRLAIAEKINQSKVKQDIQDYL